MRAASKVDIVTVKRSETRSLHCSRTERKIVFPEFPPPRSKLNTSFLHPDDDVTAATCPMRTVAYYVNGLIISISVGGKIGRRARRDRITVEIYALSVGRRIISTSRKRGIDHRAKQTRGIIRRHYATPLRYLNRGPRLLQFPRLRAKFSYR